MSFAMWCVLVAGLMPLITVGIAKSKGREGGGYLRHNDLPRDWLEKQSGLARRAHAAHLNSFEAFPFFAAAVVIATLCKAPQATIDVLAGVFILARFAYLACYLADKATLRSITWMVGLACVVGMFFVAGFSR